MTTRPTCAHVHVDLAHMQCKMEGHDLVHFEIQVLNNLMPTVNKTCEDAISDIDAQRWQEALDVRNRLEACNSGGVMSFKVMCPGGTAKTVR